MSDVKQMTVTLTQQKDYQFLVDFGGMMPSLQTDEGAPLGTDTGPNPEQMLAAAVANCLSASLLFAMRKYKNQPDPLRTTATITMTRNEQGRIRVGNLDVELNLAADAAELQQVERILAQFEDFCVVTQSVRSGIAVSVKVRDKAGQLLHSAG
ncbi:MAG: OsmC family protein [Burkholderiales bacterium]|nr:OsmC family protein [Burkholderiales bacterium]